MAAVTVSRSADRLIAVKQVQAARAAEIEREADLLKRLDHPGLVRFIDIVDNADGGRALHTEFVSSDTWATRPLTDPAERAAGMAALAAVVADLHHLGVAHLQLTPAHVLHGENDRPVLCGLTLAAEATPENRHTDLAALADLCHDPTLDRGALTGKLATLADAARAGRLSARELARRLDLLGARRPTAAEPIRTVDGGILGRLKSPSTHKSLIAVAALAAAVVAAMALGVWDRSPQHPGAAPAPPSGDAATDTSGIESGQVDGANPPVASTADTPGGVGFNPPLLPPSAAGQSLNEPVSVGEAAAVLEHGGRRYAVGATGDFVATGDWDCDGEPTAAIVRPSTGDIALFDAWPGPGETISLPVRWNADSPTGAEAVRHGPCDLLRVYTTAGSRLFNPGESP